MTHTHECMILETENQIAPTHAASLHLPLQLLALNLVQEIKVGLVKVVHTDVTVLTTRGVCCTLGVDTDGVEGTEVTTDTADFVLEDLVVETSLEFTLASGGGGDIHGRLTTSQDHVFLLGCDGGAVEGGVGNVGLEDGEITGGHELYDISGPFQTRDSTKIINAPWRSCLSMR